VPVPSGVIQGSAIGPLLFLIFINDLPEVVRYASVKLFADDLKLYCAVNNLSDRERLQVEINAVANWSHVWLLPLCLSKLLYVHLGAHHDDCAYYCNDIVIQQLNVAKDLGVSYNVDLSFRPHYTSICKKAHATCAIIVVDEQI
jgi:ribonuclease P/MRP protein subunit RPP40